MFKGTSCSNIALKGQVSNVCYLTNLTPMDGCNGEKSFVSLRGLTLILFGS